MTMELLDTDTENSEDPVEVERWSEYVEKYIAGDETVTDELKSELTIKSNSKNLKRVTSS